MKFKVSELGNQFKNVHPILHNLVVWVDDYCLNKFKKEITITEIERTHEDSVRLYSSQINTKTKEFYKPDEVPVSVHEVKPCRGVDIRASDFSGVDCLTIQYVINSAWFYDPDRINLKCCLYHKVGNDGVHFHLQVCDKTVEVN